MAKQRVHVRLIYGQTGKSPLSHQFVLFKDRLQHLGYDVADDIGWKHPQRIARDLERRRGPVAIIGHSMGALCTSWAAAATNREIDLIVAYDPSGGYGPIGAGPPSPIGENVKRTICFVGINPHDMFREAPLTGHNVELIKTQTMHFDMMKDETMHSRTIAELERIKGESS